MRVAKSFRWEAAHRIPWHEGGCQHLHGHSYRMFVEVEGPVSAGGMVVDFKEIKQWLSPLISEWDHATLVSATDAELLDIVRTHGWRHAVLPSDTTAENMANHVCDHLLAASRPRLEALGIQSVRVRIEETETCYAEAERAV